MPEGHVIWQKPRAGSELRADKKVYVAISLGPGVRVPDVAGKSEQEASRILTQMGLHVDTSRRRAEAEKDHAISSVPEAGEIVLAGSSVALVISSGPPHGVLRVEAEPRDWDIWVYVDGGEARGKCPISLRLMPGEYSVVLWSPTHQKNVSFSATVEPGRTSTVRTNLE